MNEQEIQKKFKELLDYPSFNAFNNYFKLHGKIGYLIVNEENSIFLAGIRYGKAWVYFDAYINDKGMITDIVYDLRNVYDVYQKLGSKDRVKKEIFTCAEDLHRNIVRYIKGGQYFYVNDYIVACEHNKNEEPYFALGTTLVGYKNDKFNKYTPWAGALNDLLEALDEAFGFVYVGKKNRMKREEVDKAANHYSLFYWIATVFFDAVLLGSLALIIAGIAKAIKPWVGWVFGIIALLVGLFFGLTLTTMPITYKKNYKNNSGDLEKKFEEPTKSRFTIIK